jgi:hypothetical protein
MIQGDQGYAYGKLEGTSAKAMGWKPVCANYVREWASFWVPDDFTTIPGSSSQIACTTLDEPACGAR